MRPPRTGAPVSSFWEIHRAAKGARFGRSCGPRGSFISVAAAFEPRDTAPKGWMRRGSLAYAYYKVICCPASWDDGLTDDGYKSGGGDERSVVPTSKRVHPGLPGAFDQHRRPSASFAPDRTNRRRSPMSHISLHVKSTFSTGKPAVLVSPRTRACTTPRPTRARAAHRWRPSNLEPPVPRRRQCAPAEVPSAPGYDEVTACH